MAKNQELFSNKDFEELTYPMMEVKPDVNLLAKFPTLGAIKSWKEYQGRDKNILIRYIVLCYDRTSPILKKYQQDDVKRKTISAEYAGWQADSEGIFDDYVDEILKCRNETVNSMIIDFIRTFHDPSWALLVVGLEGYYQKLQTMIQLTESVGSKRDAFAMEETKGKLFKQAQEMSISLENTANKMLNDINPYLRRDLFCVIDQESKNRLKISPERMLGIE